MFKTYTQYIWEYKAAQYEKAFNSPIPEWVKTIDPKRAIKVISLALRCRWRLPHEVLITGEPLSGYQSLWHKRPNHWDKPLKKDGGKQ